MLYEDVRREVVEVSKRMSRDGLVKLTSGNVSARIPGTDYFAITPSGMDYESMTPADIVVLDMDLNVIDGDRVPSTERRHHQIAYQRRPDVNGVVHTHAIYASAFACLGQEMPIISTELAALCGSQIPCARYAKAGTEDFAVAFMEALGERNMVVLLQNHGVTSVGRSLAEAYNIAIGVDEAAQIYFIAKQLGNPIVLPTEERERMFRVFREAYGQVKTEQ